MTRRAKSHTGESREEMLDRIDAKIRADVDGGLAEVAHTVLEAREQAPLAQTWSPQAVIELALEDVRHAKAGWTRADLTAAINAALPDYLGLPDGADVARLLDSLTDTALDQALALDTPRPGDEQLPDELRLRNGRSGYEAPAGRLYATPDQVHTERALIAATAAGGATALTDVAARRFVEQLRESGIELGADQAAAVRGILTSGQRVECLIGPAGTGKSFVVGALAHAWTTSDDQRRVFGLATSQIATDVLAAEGLTARNVTRWLDTQTKLARGPGAGGPQPGEGDEAWRLRAGDLVVVDESAMTDTAALATVFSHVEAAGAKLLLVGDHRQLAAVGAGGAMELLAQLGTRYELVEARRFNHEWEREASLRLRDGDEDVLRVYHQQGRLLDSGTRDQAEQSAARAWLADTLAGRQSVLVVDDNNAAARLCGQLRAELVRLGRVDEHGVPLKQGTVAGVGDLVQARWNAWDLAGYQGNRRGPINRETYEVTGVRDDGALEVRLATRTGPNGEQLGQRLVLPARYVAEHLALAYASTVHAAQGRTTDTSHAVITSWTSLAALYVALSRGRDENTAHIATTSTIEDPAQGRPDQTVHRDPIALLAGILDRHDPLGNSSTLAIAAASAAQSANVQTPAELLADAAALAATERTARWLDQLVDAGHLTPGQRRKLAAEDGASLGPVLRRVELAGLDPRQVLIEAVADRSLDGATNATSVIVARITDHNTRRFDPIGSSWAEWVPRTDSPAWDNYLAALAAAADERTAQLGREAAEQPPAWAAETLGPVPTDAAARAEWERRAGIVASYRELRGHTDETDALGRPPTTGRQTEAYAAYRAAWDALGRPEVQQAEHEMSNGQHRVRIRAWQRERAIAPRYVGNELAGTRQAAAHHHQTATLRTAEAGHTAGPAEQARLAREAADARALAETLDRRVAELEALDAAYARHRLHTTVTRLNAEISEQILAERHAPLDDPEELITSDDWLAAHRAAIDDEDQHRVISEDDVTDGTPRSRVETRVENAVEPDLREIAAFEPRQTREDETRVPAATEVLDTTERARRTIHELNARDAYDQQAEEEERAAQLARWYGDDQAEHTATLDEGPALGRDRPDYQPAN